MAYQQDDGAGPTSHNIYEESKWKGDHASSAVFIISIEINGKSHVHVQPTQYSFFYLDIAVGGPLDG